MSLVLRKSVFATLLTVSVWACTAKPETAGADQLDSSGGDSASASTGRGLGSGQGGYDGSVEACEKLHDELEQAIDAVYAEQPPVGGAAMAVRTEVCGPWVGAVGWANAERTMLPGLLMRVGTVTKTYVAATVVALAELGKLSLADRLSTHLPGVANGDLVTVRMLLRHTSGFHDYTDTAFYDTALGQPDSAVTPQQIVDAATSQSQDFAPGARWAYSSTGYILAGMLIEEVTGMSVAEAVRVHALGPAGLNATFFAGEETVPAELAAGHDVLGADSTNALHPSMSWAAGGMVANVADMAKWAAALYGGDVLSPSGLNTMLEAVAIDQSGISCGLGVFVFGEQMMGGLGEAVGHAGHIPGYQADMIYLRDSRTVVAVIANSDAASSTSYMNAALMALSQR